MAKIAAVLPDDLKVKLDATGLLVGPGDDVEIGAVEIAAIRRAIRSEHKLEITYVDDKAQESRRTVWPFALAYFDHVRIIAAWCELRQDYRHFRIDRIHSLTVTEIRYPRRRQALMHEWREEQGISVP